MADEVNAQQDNKKQKPTFPNMVFPSAGEIDSEYFGGTAPEKISLNEFMEYSKKPTIGGWHALHYFMEKGLCVWMQLS